MGLVLFRSVPIALRSGTHPNPIIKKKICYEEYLTKPISSRAVSAFFSDICIVNWGRAIDKFG